MSSASSPKLAPVQEPDPARGEPPFSRGEPVAALAIEGLSKRFGSIAALQSVDLRLQPGELLTLLGPSGCGKSTLLRILAGLLTADQGAIYFSGRRVDALPTRRRDIGMVFQSHAVFPHLNVADNVAYGLRARGVSAAEIPGRVEEALAQVQLAGCAQRRPEQLSGGQQQRVALARALVTRPTLLLMDEPLSNLDAPLRVVLRAEIRQLQRRLGLTTLYVTHDQEEALGISDRIAVLDGGRLQQVATPAELYQRPNNLMVAAFVGGCSLLSVTVTEGQVTSPDLRFPRALQRSYAGPARLGLRPKALRPVDEAAPGCVVRGALQNESFLGAYSLLQVLLSSGESVAAWSTRPPGTYLMGQPLTLAFLPEDALLFDGRSGAALR